MHVLAAIIAIGPVAVAGSMFPSTVRGALEATAAVGGEPQAAMVGTLHRITRVYASIGTAGPVVGVATALALGVLDEVWLMISIVCTAAAIVVLVVQILPAEAAVLAVLDGEGPGSKSDAMTATRRIGILMGVFNLLWAVVVVLMIVRPGSTTGAGL